MNQPNQAGYTRDVNFVPFLESAGLVSRGSNWLRSLYCRVICSFLWLFPVGQFVIHIGYTYVQLMLGDLTDYWNGHRMYFLWPSCLLGLQAALCCTLFRRYGSQLNWFVPFEAIRPMRCAKIIIDHTVHNVRINISIILALAIASVSTVFVGFETIRTAYENLNEKDFRMCITWMVFQIVWWFYLVYINCLVAAYFNLVCLMISKRFETIYHSICALTNVNLETLEVHHSTIERICNDHHHASELLQKSNVFWQNYICHTLLFYLQCAFYVLYIIVFVDFDTTLAVFTWGIFTHTLIILLIICVSATSVSAWAHAPLGQLKTLEQNARNSRTKSLLRSFIDHVQGAGIGYKCGNLFVMTYASVMRTIAFAAFYFLIAAVFCRFITNRFQNMYQNFIHGRKEDHALHNDTQSQPF